MIVNNTFEVNGINELISTDITHYYVKNNDVTYPSVDITFTEPITTLVPYEYEYDFSSFPTLIPTFIPIPQLNKQTLFSDVEKLIDEDKNFILELEELIKRKKNIKHKCDKCCNKNK